MTWRVIQKQFLICELSLSKYRVAGTQTHHPTLIFYAHNREAQANTLELGFAAEGYLREELWQADAGCYQDIHRNGMTQQQFKSHPRLQRLAQRLLGLNIK